MREGGEIGVVDLHVIVAGGYHRSSCFGRSADGCGVSDWLLLDPTRHHLLRLTLCPWPDLGWMGCSDRCGQAPAVELLPFKEGSIARSSLPRGPGYWCISVSFILIFIGLPLGGKLGNLLGDVRCVGDQVVDRRAGVLFLERLAVLRESLWITGRKVVDALIPCWIGVGLLHVHLHGTAVPSSARGDKGGRARISGLPFLHAVDVVKQGLQF